MSKKRKEELIKKLKPYWNHFQEIQSDFYKKKTALEEKMSRELGLGIDLEFFNVDGDYVGIGAVNPVYRKKNKKYFPLIRDYELDN